MITDILPIIEKLAATSSRTEKEAILFEQRDNVVLKAFFEAACNKFRAYNIKIIPPYKCGNDYIGRPLMQAINDLYMFEERILTGKKAQDRLSSILSALSSENATLMIRIIKKDPNCGVGASVINKVWPNLIPVAVYMGATPMSDSALERLDYDAGVYSQNKEDGLFITQMFNKAGTPTQFGRSGKQYDFKGSFDMLGDTFKNCRVDGEMRVWDKDFTKFMHRKAGNGYVNKFQVGKPSCKADTSRLCYIVWDIVPYNDALAGECKIPYHQRLQVLHNAVKHSRSVYLEEMTQIRRIPEIQLVDTKIVNSLEDAKLMFKRVKAAGEEGLILKEMHGHWVNGKPWWQVKLKNETEVEFKIIGFNEHSKDPNRLGSFIVASADGKIVTSCGSGLTEEQSFDYWVRRESMMGQIISLKFESIIWKENTVVLSLNLPIFLEVRDDKTEANTLKDCIDQWEDSTGCTIEREISDRLNS
jgi:hypothetical protein